MATAGAGPDGTFGNRFDDPEGAYRVLYASSQRLGCYLETLARFRVDPALHAELAEIGGEDDFTQFGHVLNAGVLRQAGLRELTQRASRLVYNSAFDGIRYLSRYDHNTCNWALFEPFKINPKGAARLDLGDPDLQEALAIHHLQLGT